MNGVILNSSHEETQRLAAVIPEVWALEAQIRTATSDSEVWSRVDKIRAYLEGLADREGLDLHVLRTRILPEPPCSCDICQE